MPNSEKSANFSQLPCFETVPQQTLFCSSKFPSAFFHLMLSHPSWDASQFYPPVNSPLILLYTFHSITINLTSDIYQALFQMWLPQWLGSKESTYNSGDMDLIPGLGRSHGKANGNPFQYSCLENPMDMGMTQRDVMGREVGGGFMFGNACKN